MNIKDNKIQKTLSQKNPHQIDEWQGNYGLNINYGKLDENSEMAIDYDIEINSDKCQFAGMGYKTYFTNQCKTEEKIILSF